MNKKSTLPKDMTGACMRGGITIDEDEMKELPDANYWRMGAKGAELAIRKMVDCHHFFGCKLDKILGRFWKQENTWMYICLKTERVRDLIKALRS